MSRKTRRIHPKRGGGRTQPKTMKNKGRLGPIERYSMKLAPNRPVFSKENINAVMAQQQRNAVIKQNVEQLLVNERNADDLDPEWPDKVFEKFTDFLEKLVEIEEEMFEEGKDTSDISILKINIATKLIELFGKRAAAANVPKEEKVNAFDADLDNLLSSFGKVGL
jgi:septum formation topological specificity factor MinE